MQSLDLDAKISLTKARIQAWYEHWDGEVYVCFSGGKDSTVLLHLVRQIYPGVPAAFADTGLEYPEIRDFVRMIENVRWIRPAMSFKAARPGDAHLARSFCPKAKAMAAMPITVRVGKRRFAALLR